MNAWVGQAIAFRGLPIQEQRQTTKTIVCPT